MSEQAIDQPAGHDLRRHKHSLLLGSLVALLLLSPLFSKVGDGSLALSALFTLVLIAGTLAVGQAKRDLILILGLSLGWLYLTWLHPVWSGSTLDAISGAIFVACTLHMSAVLLRSVLSAERVTHDVISGAIAVYLLLGVGWAVIYLLIENASPGSFAFGEGNSGTIWDRLIYFSFTTLTTLGYGDIQPLSAAARIWAVFEAICGTLYLAVLVSRLVGLYRA